MNIKMLDIYEKACQVFTLNLTSTAGKLDGTSGTVENEGVPISKSGREAHFRQFAEDT